MCNIELFPQVLKNNADGQYRSCLLKQSAANEKVIEEKLWFLYPTDLPMSEDDDCDAYLLAILLPAMLRHADIHVHGSVSRELLANLTELQHVWNKWLPERFFLVDIYVDHIREHDIQVEGAVAAFSGGVDAQFTAYRHAKGVAGYATRDIKAGVFIHGFDIPLDDIEGFAGAAKIATKILDDLSIDLLIVKTNVREIWNGISSINWEDYHAAAIASVLCGLKQYAGTGLIASGDSYDALISPWGSHPITDPLLSSSAFRVIHDGAGFSRSQKLSTLSEWSLGIENLRVCWSGGVHDSNCGRCEKCVRTRLNLLVAGIQNPKCFNTPINADIFKYLVLKNEIVRIEWRFIRNEMIETGNGLEWLPKVDKVLKRQPAFTFNGLLPAGSKRRAWVKQLLTKNRSRSA